MKIMSQTAAVAAANVRNPTAWLTLVSTICSGLVALLVGFADRPTEIGNIPLQKTDEWASINDDNAAPLPVRDERWGLTGEDTGWEFSAMQPFSFAARGLTILVPQLLSGKPAMGPVHRVPRPLPGDAPRGCLATLRIYP